MSQIEIKRTVNLDRMITTEALPGALYYAENQAHKFVIAAKRGEADVALSGTVFGSFVRHGDGATIPLTGAIEDGCAAITLISNCYLVPGRFDLAVYVTEGGVTTMVYACTGHVRATETGEAVDPSGEVALNVAQLIEDIEEAQSGLVVLPLPVAKGGTAAINASTARSNLGADNASNLTRGTVNMARLPFKVAYGRATVRTGSSTTVNFSEVGFQEAPYVVATISTTDSTTPSVTSAVRIYGVTTSRAVLSLPSSSSSTSVLVAWIAIGN